ncbi:hypothetical protein SAMN05444000_107153 [Shimia gijangensis]|uniref:DUF4149 domain-containing protein n=1 Tax=Shimia gijangensis TaxID=1470563 RepID=A0A1M6IKK5_9RHOB|nr:hypothetical protein [Shimia gijangensis]SHJ35016.1 hypothetical protein SAMN05444000_107153 [Shimia gijangensis]
MHRAFWVSFTAAMAIYLTMALWSVPFISSQAGGQVPFDMRPFGYSLSEAILFLSALSDEGREFYLTVQHRLDIAYLALVGLALVLGLQMVLRRPWGTVFSLVALIATAADYFENYLVAGLLNTPIEAVDEITVQVASFLTMSKSISHMICFSALLLGTVNLVLRRVLR